MINIVGIIITIFCIWNTGTAMADDSGGYLPGSTDMCKIEQAWTTIGKEPKEAVLDWRNMNGINYMTTPQYQHPCVTCWAFAALHLLEAAIRIRDYPDSPTFTEDFSEDSITDCTSPAGCLTNYGNYWKSGSYLMAQGPVLESCQPWSPGYPICTPTCPQENYRLKRLITIANTVPAIKAALVNGPVGTSMHTGATAEPFSMYYDGTYMFTQGTPQTLTNHAVVIVGYHEGPAQPGYIEGDYWICQNSWGTQFGDDGYFYIEYGAANIGTSCFQITEWEDSLENLGKVLVYEDGNGAGGYIGGAPNVIYACQRLIPPRTDHITSIQWANTGNNFDYEIRVYDAFSGSSPESLMGEPIVGINEPYGGLINVDLADPIPVTAGDDIYVCIKLHNPTGDVHPMEVSGTTYSGGAWISFEAIDAAYTPNSQVFPTPPPPTPIPIPRDWGIRVVLGGPLPPTATPLPPIPATTPGGFGVLAVALGILLSISVFRQRG